MKSRVLSLAIPLAFALGLRPSFAVDPADYVAASDCATGSSTATLMIVPAGKTLLVTDIHIGSDEFTGTVTHPYHFQVRQSGNAVQDYRTSPRATNGFAQSGAIDLDLRLASPLVITEGNTLEIAATLPGSWSTVEWCASIGGQLVANVALGAAEIRPDPDGNGPKLAVFPNPAAGGQRLRFSTEDVAHVTLDVFDVGGRRVARLEDGVLPPGRHERIWDGAGPDGKRVADGTYFPKLTVAGKSVTSRLVVLN